MTTELLLKLTRWAHEDPSDEIVQANLALAGAGAEAYLAGADVPMGEDMREEDVPLRELTVLKLALYFYEVRAADPRYGYVSLPPDLNHLVNSLRSAPRRKEGSA